MVGEVAGENVGDVGVSVGEDVGADVFSTVQMCALSGCGGPKEKHKRRRERHGHHFVTDLDFDDFLREQFHSFSSKKVNSQIS